MCWEVGAKDKQCKKQENGNTPEIKLVALLYNMFPGRAIPNLQRDILLGKRPWLSITGGHIDIPEMKQ